MNINEQVEVKLTDYGKYIYNLYFLNLKIAAPKLENNIFKTELWNLMNIFGTVCYMGNTEITFENNEIKIVEEISNE